MSRRGEADTWPDTSKLVYWARAIIKRSHVDERTYTFRGVRVYVVDAGSEPTRHGWRGWMVSLYAPAEDGFTHYREAGAHLIWYRREDFKSGDGVREFGLPVATPVERGGFTLAIEYAQWRGRVEQPRVDAGDPTQEDLELLTEHLLPRAFEFYNEAQARVVPDLDADPTRAPPEFVMRNPWPSSSRGARSPRRSSRSAGATTRSSRRR